MKNKGQKKAIITSAMAFILLMGFVSLFSDMTHEGANSVIGNFLSLAGANAATIGFISGLGMFLGYALRILSSYIVDKTHKYWLFTIIGYALDLVFIPLLFFVQEGGWLLACFFITGEKIGKAIKKPAKDSLISFASTQTGTGKGFAIGEVIDQLGAFLGPLILFVVGLIANKNDTFFVYRISFSVLGIPAIICLILLFIARAKFPKPDEFEREDKNAPKGKILTKKFVFFIIAVGLFAFGFADFSLITMHIANHNYVDATYLPLFYALAMLVDALAAYIFGILYDKKGILSIIISTLICAPFSFFIFYVNTLWSTVIGLILWGVGMGAVESIIKAYVTDLTTKNTRSRAFGIYDTFFGLTWFLGSWIIGIFYDISPLGIVLLSTISVACSVIFYLLSYHYQKKEKMAELISHPDSQD